MYRFCQQPLRPILHINDTAHLSNTRQLPRLLFYQNSPCILLWDFLGFSPSWSCQCCSCWCCWYMINLLNWPYNIVTKTVCYATRLYERVPLRDEFLHQARVLLLGEAGRVGGVQSLKLLQQCNVTWSPAPRGGGAPRPAWCGGGVNLAGGGWLVPPRPRWYRLYAPHQTMETSQHPAPCLNTQPHNNNCHCNNRSELYILILLHNFIRKFPFMYLYNVPFINQLWRECDPWCHALSAFTSP